MESKNLRVTWARYAVTGAAFALVTLFLLWLSRYVTFFAAIFLPVLLSVIIAYIFNPLVVFLEYRQVPRCLGILALYAVFFSILLVFGVTLIPSLINELQKMAEKVPEYTRQFQGFLLHLQSDYQRINIPESVRLVLDQNILDLQVSVQYALERVTASVLNLFSHLFTILIIPLLVYYILRDMESLKKSFVMLFPKTYRKWIAAMGSEMDRTLGAYFRGMLFICFLVGVMTYGAFLIIGLDFALILGIIAGLTNIIPYFGQLIGAVPAVLIALLHSPAMALQVILAIVIVQQIESQIIAPQILGRNLGLHPLVVILVMILGGKLFGLTGLIFAVPFAAMLRIFLRYMADLAANRQT